jgi:hypothetical protein
MQCTVVKIMPSSPEQGEYVVINESDFDASVHTLFGVDEKTSMSKAELQAALDAKGIAHKPAMSKAELQSMLDAS